MRPIRHCINKQLSTLCQHALELEALSNKVLQLLPTELTPCQVAQFTKGCLLLTTTDPAVASQLRYLIPELRDKLRKEGGLYQLISIKVNVIEPCNDYKKPPSPIKSTLSLKAKANIIKASERCTYHPLKEALNHLAGVDNE